MVYACCCRDPAQRPENPCQGRKEGRYDDYRTQENDGLQPLGQATQIKEALFPPDIGRNAALLRDDGKGKKTCSGTDKAEDQKAAAVALSGLATAKANTRPL